MKYPITPSYIRNAPKQIEEFYENLGLWILRDICERLKYSDGLQQTAIEQIRELQRRGYSYDAIKRYIQKTANLSKAEFERIIQKAIEDNASYYSGILDESTLLEVTFNSEAMQDEIAAIISQCGDQLNNITRSLGFCMKQGVKTTFIPIAEVYQKILSDATLRVWAGAQSYGEAIRGSVKELADSGIRTVTWSENDKVYHTDHADVAARRAVMTGITQISSRYSEQIREAVPTDYMEITAHQGARDVDVAGKPWCNHKDWQGKVYSIRTNDIYPSVYEICGWGLVDGLEGANCRHLHYPFWEGISERTYTDEELANIDPPDFEYNGRTYSAYAATQRQREIERGLRKCKREMLAFEACGDDTAYKEAAVKYRRLDSLYKDFTEKSGLRSQITRGNIAEFGPGEVRKAEKTADAIEKEASAMYDLGSADENVKAYLRDLLIRNRIKTQYPNSLNSGQQRKHVQGTHEFQQYVAKIRGRGEFGPARVTISDDEIREIVSRYMGTGILDRNNATGEFRNVETITINEKIVGVCVNNMNGVEAMTSVFKIHYSKKHGYHIVPDYPSKKGAKQRK